MYRLANIYECGNFHTAIWKYNLTGMSPVLHDKHFDNSALVLIPVYVTRSVVYVSLDDSDAYFALTF